VLACDGIVGWKLRISFFQRRAGLTTVVATTAAGRQGYEIQDVDGDRALAIVTTATPGLLEPFLERTGPRPAS
jgi:putative membrane protein